MDFVAPGSALGKELVNGIKDHDSESVGIGSWV